LGQQKGPKADQTEPGVGLEMGTGLGLGMGMGMRMRMRLGADGEETD